MLTLERYRAIETTVNMMMLMMLMMLIMMEIMLTINLLSYTLQVTQRQM